MLSDIEVLEVANVLKSIGNANRLRILCSLIEQELSVNQIVDVSNITQSAVSQHLKNLREQGLVTSRQDNKYIYYKLVDKRIEGLLKLLKESYCEVER